MKTKNKYSRRSFVKKGSILVPGTIFGLAGCVSNSKKSLDADVIIIGAGLSGLNASLLLQEFGYKTMIIEATDRVGGRVFTADENDVPGAPELGANGLGGGYSRLLSRAKEFHVPIGPMRPRTEPRPGEVFIQYKKQSILREDWKNHPANPFGTDWAKDNYPSSVAWRIYSQTNPLPSMNLDGWRTPEFTKQDKSIYTLLKENGFSDEAIQLTGSTNPSYGVTAKETSALMFYQILNFIEHQSKFEGGGAALGGNQQIPLAMAGAFNGDILTKSPVKSIKSEAEKVSITLDNDKTFTAKYVIVTVPFSALRHIQLDPLPKGKIKEAIDGLDYTPCNQYHFIPKRKFWEQDELPPSMWSDEFCGRFMALKNDVENPNEVTSYVAYVNGKKAQELDKMGVEDGKKAILNVLAEIRPSTKEALEFTHHWTWSNNRFAGGAYAFWKPGQIASFSNEIATPIDRIHFAGEHTAILARGMEGAMESGERVALEVMNLM